MGITARGAWESVKRHFREIGVDTQSQPTSPWSASATCRATCSATACCCRAHIRLVAAFDHRHVFIDPNPDAARSFRRARAPVQAAALVVGRLRHHADLGRRRRLVALARSRSRCRRRRCAALGIDAVGTTQAHAHRTAQRDPEGAGGPALQRRHRHLRQGAQRRPTPRSATAPTTRCASTARICAARWSPKAATWAAPSVGRIEAALAGVRINTDAIDNSAGVDTSDHEVNIKILLGLAVATAR